MAKVPLKAVLRELKRREIRFAKSPKEQVKMFGELQREVNEIIRKALAVNDYGSIKEAIKKARALKGEGFHFVSGIESALENLLNSIEYTKKAGDKLNDDFKKYSGLMEIVQKMRKNREI